MALSEIINHIIYYRNNNEFIVLMKIEDKKRKVKIIRNLQIKCLLPVKNNNNHKNSRKNHNILLAEASPHSIEFLTLNHK